MAVAWSSRSSSDERDEGDLCRRASAWDLRSRRASFLTRPESHPYTRTTRRVALGDHWGLGGTMLVEMVVESVRGNLQTYQRVVVLKEKGAHRYLPIWIGHNEADAIVIQ